jgi:hypothetical protein
MKSESDSYRHAATAKTDLETSDVSLPYGSIDGGYHNPNGKQ